MSHFAEIDNNNIVQRVIVVEQDVIDSGLFGDSSNWVQTSYNTRGGIHYAPNSNEPDGGVALRKNYAGKGYTYDQARDAFIPPKNCSYLVLNEDTCLWEHPIPYPDDGGNYIWEEDSNGWITNPKELEDA